MKSSKTAVVWPSIAICLFCMGVCVATGMADPRNPDTDWMVGKVGAFMHFLPSVEEHEKRIGDFDVNGLRDQLVHMGVDYFIFTLGQNNNVYTADNAMYRKLMGTDAVTRFSRRDLPKEIIASLKGTGIRFGLYSPCQPSFGDEAAERAFGFERLHPDRRGDWRMTDRGAANWARVVGEWAERYGEDVAIWWFDGGRPDMGFCEAYGRQFRDALRRGNPKMVVSFNYGLLDWAMATGRAYGLRCEDDPSFPEKVRFREFREKFEGMAPPAEKRDADDPMKWTGGRLERVEMVQWLACADYTPGEVAEPFRFMPEGRWFNDNQYHVLTYLGHYWGERHCRYPDEIWIKYLKRYLAKGGCISFDLSIDRKDKSGRFVDDHVNQMRRMLRAVRNRQVPVD